MTPANIARAAVEGATLGLAYGLQRFRELGIVLTLDLSGDLANAPPPFLVFPFFPVIYQQRRPETVDEIRRWGAAQCTIQLLSVKRY